MNRCIELADVVGKGLRSWQSLYMAVFAIFATIANLDNQDNDGAVLLAVVYLLLSLFSLIVLLPHFRRVLFRLSDPIRSRRTMGRPVSSIGWRLYLYIAFPLAAIGFLQLFSALMGLFLQFSESNVSSNPSSSDYLVTVVAGMEELWRWSMIGTVLMASRFLFRSVWHRETTRLFAFVLACVLSSLAFGAGHILEFSSHLLRAWLLFSLLGAVLAVFTIMTGRILLTMAIHSGYDLWITWISSPSANDAVVNLMLFILLVVILVTVVFHRAIFHRISLFREDVHLSEYTPSWSAFYERESDVLREVFQRRRALDIQHVGSTAVEGMLANNVIDIQVAVSGRLLKPSERRNLERIGYVVCGNVGTPGRFLLVRSGTIPYHVQMVRYGGHDAKTAVQLREYFRDDAIAATAFGQMKQIIVSDGIRGYIPYMRAKSGTMSTFIAKAHERYLM